MAEPIDGPGGRDGSAIGRRAGSETAYLLPRHHTEIDRLDVQHYALRAALRGNYMAPVSNPGRILDVGAGTGQWAYDLCTEFPDAVVVGFDMEPTKPARPPNFRLVTGNVLKGLPFGDHRFDFVHQRLMLTAVPLANWQALVRDLVRVTRPGGILELTEIGDNMAPIGSASKRLWDLGNGLAEAFGIDGSGIVIRSLDEWLRDAGAVDVVRREVALPIGDWGDRIGSLMASDYRALWTRLCTPLEARFGLGPGECEELLAASLRECEELHSNAIFTFVHGRKAPEPASG